MKFQPLRSLRGRLLLLALLVEALMLSLLIANNLRLLRDNMGEQAKLQAEQIAPVIGAALIAPLAQSDYATVQAVLDDSHAARGIEYLAVTDKSGRLVAISGWATGKPLPPPQRELVLDDDSSGPRYDVARPVTLAGQQLGTLQFGLDLKHIIEARRSLLFQGVLIAVGELLLSAALLTLLGMLITRQLSALTQASNQVAEGNMSPPRVQEGDDDVGRLGVAFNKMSETVSERILEITTARDEMARLAETNEQDRARMAALVAALEFGLLFSDRKDRFVFANQTLGKLWGIDIGAIEMGANLQALLSLLLPQVKSANADVNDLIRGDATEAEILLRDSRILQLTCLPVTSQSGDALGRLWLFSDVTRDRHAAQQLLAAKEAADSANLAKSDFLANMSHEIRTPMNGVMGMIDLALDSELTDEQRELLNLARSSADSLLRIINDILDFSKIEAGKVDVECIAFDLRSLLDEIVAAARFGADKKGLQLLEHTADDVPQVINGDPVRLRQVVVNLIGNSIKFTQSGNITISTEIDVRSASKPLLHISVRDTGIGIPLDKQERIFDAFTQQDASTTRRYGGTGLGLTICSRFIALMGGAISVQSEPDKGSTFRISLPLMESKTQPDNAAAPETASTTAHLNILVAEDNNINQKLIATLLGRLGHTVTLAVNGQEAVDLWLEGGFDMILMDIQMPVMGGIEATTRIRQLEREQKAAAPTPIYALSASAMEIDQQLAFDAGLDGYLTKPLDRQALLDVLAQTPSQTPLDSGAAFDYGTALSKADREIVMIIGQDFLDQAPSYLLEMREALASEDWDRLRRLAHTCKGLAATFGARPVSDAAGQLEKSGQPAAARSVALDALELELTTLCATLKQYIRSN